VKQGLIAFTWDDGHKTDVTVALQEQLDRGMEPKGTSYIITGASPTNRMNIAEKLTLVNNGWDLQCHTHNHPLGPNLTGHTAEQLHEEMQLSNAHFRDELGLPEPKHLAYPGGGHNKLVRDIVGLYRTTMRTTVPMPLSKKPNWHEIPSFPFDPENLERNIRIIDACVDYGLCATFYAHEFDSQARIDAYRAMLDHCLNRKIRLVTMTELYDILTR